MVWLVRQIDRILTRVYGLVEFWDDPRSLFRLRMTRARHPVPLPGRSIPKGAAILELHFWNEHFPLIPAGGPDLAWALRIQRMLMASLRRLAGEIRTNPQYAQVQAITGMTIFISREGGNGAAALFERLGFSVLPYAGRLGRFGMRLENLWNWLLMAAYNPKSLENRRLLELNRLELWMPVDVLLLRHGAQAAEPEEG